MKTVLIVGRRQELEHVIDDAILGGRANLRKLCAALAEIQDLRLYTPEYPTFEAYAEAVWRLTPTKARELAAAHKMAATASTQTRAEDMPLYFHSYFVNVLEDTGRATAGLTPGERVGAAGVARQIGTKQGTILGEVIDELEANPEQLAQLGVEAQTDRLRSLNDAAAKLYGDKEAADFVDRLRRKLARFAEELADHPGIGRYLPAGIESGLKGLLQACRETRS